MHARDASLHVGLRGLIGHEKTLTHVKNTKNLKKKAARGLWDHG
jgi:hypothetical protein